MNLAGCDVMVFGAHPDDAEIGAGGVIAREAQKGRQVIICDLTAGEMSSNGDPVRRQAEARASADVLGVKERICLGFPDRGLVESEEQIAQLVRVLREYRPRVVLFPWHEDNHPDHRQTAQLLRSALLNSRLKKYGTDQPWSVEKAWGYCIHEQAPNPFYIALSEADGQRKQQALACYASQFEREATSIATRLHGLPQRIEWRDRYAGSIIGAPWAEGFWQREPLAVRDLWCLL